MALRANFGDVPVSESEQAAILKRGDDYRGQLSSVRQELQLAQERVSQLLTKEASLSAAIADCYYSVSGPIGGMPNDILREIFLHCLPLEASDITLDPLEAPTLLCHVCRRWRTIATSFPRLWKSLKLEMARGQMIDGTVALAVNWLERYKSPQIMLQIIIRTSILPPDPLLFGFFPKIAPFVSTRLSRLTLIRIPLTDIHILPPNSFPCLERLVLCSYDYHVDDFDWESKGPIRAFEESPCLQHVAFGLNDETLAHDPTRIPLPWSQLTHFLSLQEPPASFYATYLPQCLQLEYGLFQLGSNDVGDPPLNAPSRHAGLSMRDLTSLTLDFWSAGNSDVQYPLFFSNFDFSGLRSLRIMGCDFDFDGPDLWTNNSKNLFLKTLQKQEYLEYLSLSLSLDAFSSLASGAFEAMFECTPYVTTLDLEHFADSAGLWRLLTFAPNWVLLPNLKNIVIELGKTPLRKIDNNDPNTSEAFINFVKSRRTCEPEMHLERVVFWTDKPDDAGQQIEGIQCYVDTGLNVEVRYHSNPAKYTDTMAWMDRDPGLEGWREVKAMSDELYLL